MYILERKIDKNAFQDGALLVDFWSSEQDGSLQELYTPFILSAVLYVYQYYTVMRKYVKFSCQNSSLNDTDCCGISYQLWSALAKGKGAFTHILLTCQASAQFAYFI